MKSKMRKLEIVIYIAVLAILGTVWATNGYDETWLYVTAAIIATPISWWYKGDK